MAPIVYLVCKLNGALQLGGEAKNNYFSTWEKSVKFLEIPNIFIYFENELIML